VLLAETAYTQQQPAGLGAAAVLVLAGLGGCWLVVADSASRTETKVGDLLPTLERDCLAGYATIRHGFCCARAVNFAPRICLGEKLFAGRI
jgi:hypothetical protein